MLGLKSARVRATVASLVLLMLLASIAIFATWRARQDRSYRLEQGRTASALVYLEGARTQYYRSISLLTAALFAEDPEPLIGSYRVAQETGDAMLAQARSELAALGQDERLVSLDTFLGRLGQMRGDVDSVIAYGAASDSATRLQLGLRYFPQMWPETETILGYLGSVASQQQSAFVAADHKADRESNTSLAYLVGFSAWSFVVATAILIFLVLSIVRSLAGLQRSVRVVASGDMSVRARVAGPAEVQSLARDFNLMVEEIARAEKAERESSEKIRAITHMAPNAIIMMDGGGLITFWNPAAERIFGYTAEEALGKEAQPLLVPTRFDSKLGEGFARFKESGRGAAIGPTLELSAFRRDKTEFPVELSLSAVEIDGAWHAIGIVKDITDRKAAEEALQESEARYKALFAGAPEGMLVVDLQTKQFRHVNPAMCRMFGYTEEEFSRLGVADIHPKESLSYVLAEFEAQARGEKLLSDDIPCQRKDGSLFYANVNAIMVALDGRRCIVGSFSDITDRKAAEEVLRQQSRRDPLTGVLNHGAIAGEIRDLIAESKGDRSWAIAMVDVNFLKMVNDTYGHQVGDAALVAAARALAVGDALVGRYGGDEFVAILRGADRTAAERYCRDVADTLANSKVVDPETGTIVPVDASVGVAVFPDYATTLVDLIKISDDAMYAAKRQRHSWPESGNRAA